MMRTTIGIDKKAKRSLNTNNKNRNPVYINIINKHSILRNIIDVNAALTIPVDWPH